MLALHGETRLEIGSTLPSPFRLASLAFEPLLLVGQERSVVLEAVRECPPLQQMQQRRDYGRQKAPLVVVDQD